MILLFHLILNFLEKQRKCYTLKHKWFKRRWKIRRINGIIKIKTLNKRLKWIKLKLKLIRWLNEIIIRSFH